MNRPSMGPGENILNTFLSLVFKYYRFYIFRKSHALPEGQIKK
jgi:hypothetical protein